MRRLSASQVRAFAKEQALTRLSSAAKRLRPMWQALFYKTPHDEEFGADEYSRLADYFTTADDYEAALVHIMRARELAPTSSYLMEHEAWLRANLGQQVVAYDLWRRAHSAGNEEAALGAACYAANRRDAERVREFVLLASEADLDAARLLATEPSVRALIGSDPAVLTALRLSSRDRPWGGRA
ncbi:MAG: hypothetical protein QOE90_1494 [Thermoplasmata archaeon]|nr:hypothetical protein [Thermoplasmata archaeon]